MDYNYDPIEEINRHSKMWWWVRFLGTIIVLGALVAHFL
jgi:hypothetical protein